MWKRTRPLAFIMFIFGMLITLCGCGQAGPDLIAVHGKITFDGGPPPSNGTINFLPIKPAKGYPTRPGSANFLQGNGTFSVTSVKPDDGLVPGTYRVRIVCWRIAPTDNNTEGVSYVPASYTPSDLEIKPDQDGPIEYNLQVPLGQ